MFKYVYCYLCQRKNYHPLLSITTHERGFLQTIIYFISLVVLKSDILEEKHKLIFIDICHLSETWGKDHARKTVQEINVGDTASFNKSVTEYDVYSFAGITGDFNPAHINAVYASETSFGRIIAHGILSIGFISNVLGTQLPRQVVSIFTRNVISETGFHR